MTGAASQAGDADSSRAPGLTSGLQGSVNVHRGALLLVPQLRYISSFVFCLLSFAYSSAKPMQMKSSMAFILSDMSKETNTLF